MNYFTNTTKRILPMGRSILIPILIFIGLGFTNAAHEKTTKESQGDKYYFVYAFDKAIESYTDAKQLTTEGTRRLAKSYHNLGLNEKSAYCG